MKSYANEWRTFGNTVDFADKSTNRNTWTPLQVSKDSQDWPICFRAVIQIDLKEVTITWTETRMKQEIHSAERTFFTATLEHWYVMMVSWFLTESLFFIIIIISNIFTSTEVIPWHWWRSSEALYVISFTPRPPHWAGSRTQTENDKKRGA